MRIFKKNKQYWVQGEYCWIVKKPTTKSEIIGIILKGASVTVKKAKRGFVEIIFAPGRKPETGELFDCKGCFIQKKNLTKTLPGYWKDKP